MDRDRDMLLSVGTNYVFENFNFFGVNHFFCVISDEAMDGDQRQPMLSQQRYIK